MVEWLRVTVCTEEPQSLEGAPDSWPGLVGGKKRNE